MTCSWRTSGVTSPTVAPDCETSEAALDYFAGMMLFTVVEPDVVE
jgi:hypothetical protein